MANNSATFTITSQVTVGATVTTVAGTGTAGFSGDGSAATSAQLNAPYGVAADADGNLYIADGSNHRIRRVDVSTGVISTIAGTGTAGSSGDDGPATSATLNLPRRWPWTAMAICS